MADFSNSFEVQACIGNHIEMTNDPGVDYPIETIYQPNEAPLPLSVEELKLLDTTLDELGDAPQRKVLDKFIIYPL